MSKLYLLAIALLLGVAACAPTEPTVTFKRATCAVTSTEETRQRRIQTNCLMRQGGGFNPGKPCLLWNHRTITEQKQVISCAGDEWVRQ